VSEDNPFGLKSWQRDLIVTVAGMIGTLVGTVIARAVSGWIREKTAKALGGE